MGRAWQLQPVSILELWVSFRLVVGARGVDWAYSNNFQGNGRQFVLDVNPVNEIQCLRSYDTQDGLFDCAWSEQVGSVPRSI